MRVIERCAIARLHLPSLALQADLKLTLVQQAYQHTAHCIRGVHTLLRGTNRIVRHSAPDCATCLAHDRCIHISYC
jgi:hypothetical protein